MDTLYGRIKFKTVTKVLNAGLALTLLAGYASPVFALADANQPANAKAGQCQQATGTSNHQIFLPMVANALSSLANSAQVASTVGLNATPRQLQYQAGKTYTYAWDLAVHTKSSSRDSQGTVDKDSQTTIIRALADVTIREKTADGVFSGQVVLRDPFLCSTDGADIESISTDQVLFAALKQPLLFKQAVNGAITDLASPANAPALAVNMQKGIINALQATLQDSANTYKVEETGVQGKYSVDYTLEDKTDGLHVTKTYNQDSFSSLISRGTQDKKMQLQNRIEQVLDSEKGVFSSIKVTEGILSADESKDPANSANHGIDGVAAWSTINSEDSLKLRTVTDATAVLASSLPLATYTEDNLNADLNLGATSNPKGIDLATINLDAELAALEKDAKNPALVRRIVDLAEADTGTVVLDKLRERLQQNASNQEVAAAYIDVLVIIGTPAAQAILSTLVANKTVQAAGVSAVLTDTLQEHALIGMVMLASPTITTVTTIKTLGDDSNSPLHNQANTVLGAAAYALADENPQLAASLNAELTDKLHKATDPDSVELYLDALGNAGAPASLDTLHSYMTNTLSLGNVQLTDTLQIQIAALSALRKIPGNSAEGLLLNALNDKSSNESNQVLRETVAAVLANRKDLSGGAAAALTAYDQSMGLVPGGLYERSWYGHLGGSSIGVHLPGRVVVTSPPQYSLYLYAIQEANAHIWSYQPNLVRVQLVSIKHSLIGQTFNATLSIADNKINNNAWGIFLPCAYARNGALISDTVNMFTVKFTIPIFWALSIDLEVQGTGTFTVTYNYYHNLCNANNSSIAGTITPSVWANVSASASVNLRVARGGATLAADLLRTSLPVSLSAAYNGSALRFCTDVRANTQALNGRLYIWGDVGIDIWPFHYWRRIVEKDVWTFNTPAGSYPLLVACW